MRICIYGAGAMGTSLGFFLAREKIACDFVTRNAVHVAELKAAGWQAYLPQEMCGKYDIIFLATKQRENRAIAEFLLPFLSQDGALVTVQNGLPEEGLAEVFGAERVYGAALGWGAELHHDDSEFSLTITSDAPYHIAIGAYGGGSRLGEIESLFKGNTFSVNIGNLAEIRFAKLAVNASFSTLSVISGLTFGELSKKYKKYVVSLIREVLCVAEVYGCRQLIQNGHDIKKLFKSPFAKLILPFAMQKHANIRSGMLRDLEAGKRCDIDFVAGAVVRAGKAKGVATPMLEQAVALVHDIENGFAEIAPESLALLEVVG